ncbi:MAG: sigma factor [Nocardioidaceae bacterium]
MHARRIPPRDGGPSRARPRHQSPAHPGRLRHPPRQLPGHWLRTGTTVFGRTRVPRPSAPTAGRAPGGTISRPGEPFDDLVQVGTIGLLKAIERFELDRGSSSRPTRLPPSSGRSSGTSVTRAGRSRFPGACRRCGSRWLPLRPT